MKFKTKYSVYAPDFVGILVAITYIAWSIRGQKHDKTFTLTLWLSFILFYDFAVRIENSYSYTLGQHCWKVVSWRPIYLQSVHRPVSFSLQN